MIKKRIRARNNESDMTSRGASKFHRDNVIALSFIEDEVLTRKLLRLTRFQKYRRL